MNNLQNELELSERSYKRAVLAAKVLEAAGNPRDQVAWIAKQAGECLTSESPERRAFGLNLLRFLYKMGLVPTGRLLKNRIRGILRADPSYSVRLAALDLLGAILTKTGSTSGVSQSDYSAILSFRTKMLERSPALREYESDGVRRDIERLATGDGIRATLARIIAALD